jgi:hypothetical protein
MLSLSSMRYVLTCWVYYCPEETSANCQNLRGSRASRARSQSEDLDQVQGAVCTIVCGKTDVIASGTAPWLPARLPQNVP